jgi:hypothetical protein
VKPKPSLPQPANVSTSPPVRAAVLQGAPAVRLEDTKVGRTPPRSAGGSARAATAPAAAAPAPPPVGTAVLAGESDLSSGEVQVPAEAASALQEGKDLNVPVRLPGLAEGTLKLRKTKAAFDTAAPQSILLRHPALRAFSAATPTVLVLTVKQNKVTGFVSVGTPGPASGMNQTIAAAIAKGPALLKLPGLSSLKLPPLRNRFEGGALDLGADSLSFQLGGFLSGSGSFALDNHEFSFEGSAKVDIPGGSGGELAVKKSGEGELSGSLDLGVTLGKVQGTLKATLVKGVVSVMGTAAYADDRLNGSITIAAIDEATARDITLVKPGAGVPNIELPSPDNPGKPGKRAFCGFGTLAFRINDWLTGNASVVVNSKGQATIVGEIAPPKEFELFAKKEWKKRLFRVEIKAGYGIPVVGEVGIFAGIQLDAKAEIGPGKLYNIKLSGAYSTDKRQPKSLTLEGTINISAFAGLVLRADAGVFVTILGHDIKAGVGLNALAGVRGYAEATPKIGMREPKPGQREYFIAGHMEIAAQPVLGFSGDLFVSIETPWWSPLSDKTWTWPLFSIEYPLPGEFGIGADVDYVLGSKKWPSIEFGSVDFDSSKFLSDVMNDNADKGHGGETKKPGDWQEGPGASGPGGAKNKGGKGKQPPGSMDDGIGPIGDRKSFSDGAESHELYVEQKGMDASLMMASSPQQLSARLDQWQADFDLLQPAELKDATKSMSGARKLLTLTDENAKKLAIMKEAARHIKEVAAKEKGKSGKKKGKGNEAKKLQADLKKQEAALTEEVRKLATIMRTVKFELLPKPVQMIGGSPKVAVKPASGSFMIEVAGTIASGIILRALADRYAKARYPAGRTIVKDAEAHLDKIEPKVRDFRIKKGRVLANHLEQLKLLQTNAVETLTTYGRGLVIAHMKRSMQTEPIKRHKVVFVFYELPDQKYQDNLKAEVDRQLGRQQAGLNAMVVDIWMTNVETYKSKKFEAFDQLHEQSKKAVAAEIAQRAEKVAQQAREKVARLTQENKAALERKKAAQLELDLARKALLDIAKSPEVDSVSLRAAALAAADAAAAELTEATAAAQNVGRTSALRAATRKAERAESVFDQMMRLEQAKPDDIEKAVETAAKLKLTGRHDNVDAIRKQHGAAIKAIVTSKEYKELWAGLAEKGKSFQAILHDPDQVIGGHGMIDVSHLKVVPYADKGDPHYADWEAYLEEVKKLIGAQYVNSRLGGFAGPGETREGWPTKIAAFKTWVEQQAKGPAAYPIWLVHVLLDRTFVKHPPGTT